MSTTTRRWTRIESDGHGHKLFVEERTGRVAIADDSGSTPEQTDDGVLFIDPSRPIQVKRDAVSLPLLDEEGRHQRTIISAVDAFQYARQFRMTIRAGVCEYVVGLA